MTNTIQSFVIAGNKLQPMAGIPALDLNLLSGNGTYYLDPGPNLCPNPSFEADTSGWVVTGGPLASGAALTRVARTVGFPATAPRFGSDGGGFEGKIVTTATASEGAAFSLALAKGNYLLSMWVRGNAGGETVTVTGGTGGAGSRTRNATLTTGYTQIVLPFSMTAAESGNSFMGIYTASATVRTFFVDTVSLVAV